MKVSVFLPVRLEGFRLGGLGVLRWCRIVLMGLELDGRSRRASLFVDVE